jgi:hypothetical protein
MAVALVDNVPGLAPSWRLAISPAKGVGIVGGNRGLTDLGLSCSGAEGAVVCLPVFVNQNRSSKKATKRA